MGQNLDRARFMKMYLAAQPPIRSYLFGLLRNAQDADDVFQEVSLVLWERFGDYDDRWPFLSWAFGIARNHVARWRRSRSKTRVWLPPEVEEKLAVTAAELEEELAPQRRALQDCLEKLGPQARELLALRYEQQLSLQEIAARRKMTLNAVNKALGKIRALLADCTRQAKMEQA
jgi:RNA polymerase sigma-70 factor (ECF subfamily)